MAFVDGFEHDIFLSYARVDDQTASDASEGWVSAFERHLRVALDRRVGRMGIVKIWRDLRQVQGHRLFDRTIEEAVHGTAVFLGLTSRGYLESNYCLTEIARFHEKASSDAFGNLAAGDQLRIVNALLTNIDPREWPREHAGTGGFPFHDAVSDERRGEPSKPGSERFEDQLRNLADALHELLEALRSAMRPAATAPRPRVFLATVPDVVESLRRARQRVVEDLGRREVDVLAPPDATADDARLVERLAQADLSVHFFDDEAGGDGEPRRQLELAWEHARSQMIWVPRDLEIDDVRDDDHRRFLRGLERGEGRESSCDFVRASPMELTRLITEKLEHPRGSSDAAPSPGSTSCLLVTHDRDTAHMLPIAGALLQRGVHPYINQEANEPEVTIRTFERRLREVASLIVFYGSVSAGWVRERLDTAIQRAVADGLDLKLGVFAPPERKPEPAQFSRGFIRVELLSDADDALAFVGVS